MSLQRLAVCAVLGVLGCNSTKEAPAKAEAPRAATSVAPAHKTYGAPLGQNPTAAVGDVLKSPEKFAGQRVTVEGAVRAACTRKGCWMELSEGPDPSAAGCRVTFKDYGFFVPTDSAGSRARVDALVEAKVIKPEMVAHLESEGATFAEKSADGSAREVRLVATGVEMWR
ncbi:MAG: hypothetical protein K0R38_1543 [Polyangiaceae bacterium]|jgi:hypothetical protein|nr:hypothetical protein [Polyangiaceae bacterium]